MNKEICKCRICGNKKLELILDLGYEELTGVFPRPGEEVEGGELQLVKCVGNDSCGLVQLKHSFESEKMYGDNYGYRSGLNKSMVDHLETIVRRAESIISLTDDDLIIDVGANDGTLLSHYKNHKLDLLGMDPTGVKFKKYYKDYVDLFPDFFSAKNVLIARKDKKAKVITSIAMFYDLEDPICFAKDVCECLDDEGIWIMEQSYLPSMIETVSYDTVCHEHIEFYCLKQIEYIAERSGLKVIDAFKNDINGGSFQVTLAKKDSKHPVSASAVEMMTYENSSKYDELEIYKDFEKQIQENREAIRTFFANAKENKELVLGYGASTKGNVTLQYCGISKENMPVIADVNEDKYGKVTPATHIPIVSETEARAMKPTYFFVLPWHFREFILNKEKDYMKESGCKFVFAFPKLEIIGWEDLD